MVDDEHIEFRKEDLDNWHRLFRQFDANKDGTIDRAEFAMICDRAAKERGDPPRDDLWIARAFAEADRDRSGRIDFREFVLTSYKHKATVDPMYAANYGAAASKGDKEHAARAARLVTSVPVLRETLEHAKRSKDPNLVREAARLLYALGDAGKPTLAGIVFEEGEQLLSEKKRSTQAGNRYGVGAYNEIGLAAAGNLVDVGVVRSQITAQNLRAAGDAPAPARSLRMQTMWTDVCSALPSAHDLETVFSYFQFQGLTNMLAIAYIARFPELKYDFDLPPAFSAWQLYLGWMNIFNIDLRAVATWVGNYDLPTVLETFAELPYPSLYLLVTAAVPLAISFVNLILFYPIYQVIWLFVTVLSLVLTIAAVLAIAILDDNRLAVVGGGTLSPEFLNMLLYIGLGVFALMLLLLAAYRWFLTHVELQAVKTKIDVVAKNMGRADTVALRRYLEDNEGDDGPPPPLPVLALVRNANFTLITAFFATVDRWTPLLNVGKVISIVLGVAAIVSGIYNVLSWSECGRVQMRWASRFIDKAAVSIFLLLLSILYMPITRMLFAVWLADSQVCQPGERFPQFANELSAVSAQWLASGVVRCEPCEFASFDKYNVRWNIKYDTAGQCAARFCPGETSIRSFQDPRVDYLKTILPFFGCARTRAMCAKRATVRARARAHRCVAPPPVAAAEQPVVDRDALRLHARRAVPLLHDHHQAHHDVRADHRPLFARAH